MSTTKHINLYFDGFSFPVSYSAVKKLILNELNKLSKETGYSIDNLKIEFKDDNRDNRVAYFSRLGDVPLGFCFFINKFNNTSPNKIIDTCRHEFSHYVVCVENPGNIPEDAHGTQWKRVCGILDAKPSPIMDNNFTKHII